MFTCYSTYFVDPFLFYNKIEKRIEDRFSFKNPCLISTTRIETYEDLMSNLNLDTQMALEREMDHLDQANPQINLATVVSALNQPDLLKDPIWQHPQFPLYALLALRCQLIDGMDFTTSQFFYNVMNHPHNQGKVKEISLFKEHSYNPEAWALITETLQPFITQRDDERLNSQEKFYTHSSQPLPFMNDCQRSYFWELMRQLSPLQQRFLLVPEPNPINYSRFERLMNEEEESENITESIQTKEPNFNVFCRLSDKTFKQPLRMIPSKGMMQAYLFATGGDCTLITQFGLSSLENLHKGIICKERPLYLNFAFLPKITKADGLMCLDDLNEVEYHDFYHIDIMSLIKEDLPKFLGMAKLIQTIALKNPKVKAAAELFYELLIDIEHVNYRCYYSQKKTAHQIPLEGALFWLTINSCMKFVEEEFGYKKLLAVKKLIIEAFEENSNYYKINYKLNTNFIENLDYYVNNLNYSLDSKDFDELRYFYNYYFKRRISPDLIVKN